MAAFVNSRFESQSGTTIDNPSADSLDRLLPLLDGADNSFASLTVSDGSYVQAGGGPDRFTVEIREVGKNGSFRHLKAYKAGVLSSVSSLQIAGNIVEVRANEIFDLATVSRIFQSFIHSPLADESIQWRDITNMFL